jgi:hypothetical protein
MNLMMHEVVHQEQLLMLVFHLLSIKKKKNDLDNSNDNLIKTLFNLACSLSIN